jgi:hypothetical protein
MPIRYTVFCKRSVADVAPQQLLAGVRAADLQTLAENDEIPDEVIAEALDQLRIENVDPVGFHYANQTAVFLPHNRRQKNS